jgi:hypothetical protein
MITSYEQDKGYTPSKFLLDSLGPQVEAAAGDVPIKLYDTTIFDFTLVSKVNDFFNFFFDTIRKFETGLVVIPYIHEKYIVRDFYLANIAKEYTCWDTVYINCSNPQKVTTKVFDWVLTPQELPHKLAEIIQKNDQSR